ncbi:pyruvate dehydrogenase (acetyl-transferring) E1 component subunit alpha [Candidatus Pacearchaeota archaeon]|nr:pyruvate dehydrogenase (acetyl-transferring) E1 component subunit alpha [Candidatus Pacearchaeota archaeon]
MEKIIEKFDVPYLQILDENGNCDEKLKPSISLEMIKKIYSLLILTRIFDEKALSLQRQGRIGTFPPIKGEEACQIASAILMENGDMAFPAFREHGVYITRDLPIEMLFQYWGGDERGMKIPEKVSVFTVSIPVGTHILHATGMAMGFKFQKKKNITLTYFGEGATSEGDFHEAMNFAGEFKVPVIFICQNNQYAISTPVREQTASQTVAQKAIAYGFPGIRVDGNDIFAVYKATQLAIQRARAGKGPTLIECFTYRLGDHTTSDDAKKYRGDVELKEWEKKDPIIRFEKYLTSKKILNQKEIASEKNKATKKIEESVKRYEKIQPENSEEIFKYTYASMTEELNEQLEQFKKEVI